jgi:predicted Ser/Thr protein kinase
MDGFSPIEALLTGRLRDDEFLSAVDRVIADGSESERTILIQDWRTKSGRIRRPETRRQLDEKVRRLAWATGETLIPEDGGPPYGAAATVRVGDILSNRFVIEAELGTGGMGTVFRALDLRRQEALDRNPHVAVKTLSAEVLRRDDSLQILQREARKAQSLSHPNIVRIYDFDRDGATLFLTMELLVGVSLETTIRNNGPTGAPLAKMLPVIEQIVSALQFAHDEGIVHSDLKPGNIIILPNGRVKVIDFGIARAIPNPNDRTIDQTRFDINALGAMTPAYASPEMIEGSDPDPRDDVFALACIVFECLTGRHPFGRTPASMARAGNFIPAQPTGLQTGQWKAMLRGLHFERSQRTSSPAQFLSELTAKRGPAWLQRKALIYAGVLGIGVVCVGVGARLYFHDTVATIQYRPDSESGVANPARPPRGEATATTSDDAAARAQAAAREAERKAAEEATTLLAQQRAAEEAAARQAQQKVAEEAAARQAQQKATEEAAARQAQQKAAEETAARQAQQKATDEAAARQVQQEAIQVGPPQIAEAQRLLTSLGLDTGATDGKAGPRTREMVQAFQAAVGQPTTGEITAALLALLQRPPPSAAVRAKSLFTMAAEARRSAHTADAIRLYESALKLAPSDPDGLLALGDLRSDQKDYDAARRAYEAVQRGGGPAANTARQRLAALPAPQPAAEVPPRTGVAGAGTSTPSTVGSRAADLGNADRAAPGIGSVQPGTGTVRAQPGVDPARPFDGAYSGTARLVGFSSPNCAASFNARMTIADNKVSFRFRTDSSPIATPVATDGSFSESGINIRAVPPLRQSLNGKINGNHMEADTENISCKYHMSLSKSG